MGRLADVGAEGPMHKVGIRGLIRSYAHGMTEESCGHVGICGLTRSDAYGMREQSWGRLAYVC